MTTCRNAPFSSSIRRRSFTFSRIIGSSPPNSNRFLKRTPRVDCNSPSRQLAIAEVLTGPLKAGDEALARRYRAILDRRRPIALDVDIAESAARLRPHCDWAWPMLSRPRARWRSTPRRSSPMIATSRACARCAFCLEVETPVKEQCFRQRPSANHTVLFKPQSTSLRQDRQQQERDDVGNLDRRIDCRTRRIL